MQRTMHGAGPGEATPKKVSARNENTATADSFKAATENIAMRARIKGAAIWSAYWLAMVFRGLQ